MYDRFSGNGFFIPKKTSMKNNLSSGLKSAALGLIGGYVAKKVLDKWNGKDESPNKK
jgi:hypothetical protein